MIQTPDLLILDEPTNHLDFEMISWLETYLMNYKGALLVVTHDRYFLDRIVDKIVELENGQLQEYTGNYQVTYQKKPNGKNNSHLQNKKQNNFSTKLAWMREGVRARGTNKKLELNGLKN